MMPRTARCSRSSASSSSACYEFDAAYGFVHLDVAKRLLGKLDAGFIELRVDDLFEAHGRRRRDPDAARRPSTCAQDWADMNQSLFSALWLEKMAISITIGLIVMVAALNIVASLILLVMEKSRDIAILKTMGSSAASIRRIFMLQGLIIGVDRDDRRRGRRLHADLHRSIATS